MNRWSGPWVVRWAVRVCPDVKDVFDTEGKSQVTEWTELLKDKDEDELRKELDLSSAVGTSAVRGKEQKDKLRNVGDEGRYLYCTRVRVRKEIEGDKQESCGRLVSDE